ncbi:peptide chain release factor N(5)-glutamine methyltransferase [Kocuria massiliensis]|uniref:peptide chain release factor N(5)-glutamine methyltransferase n=1 Tax=Kocuria massiliensis TaxID=1926282 RepID=UPI001FE9581B|nr:peptide chain release factor N(5)-glutamine methyltransferase [Kocuria massiliensis]
MSRNRPAVASGTEPGRQVAGLPLDQAIRMATRRLEEAGIASARAEAELLAAHALREPSGPELTRGEVATRALTGRTSAPSFFEDLVREREGRVPLQHLTGKAPFRHLTLSVGPGVFIPRPETELLIEHLNGYLGSLSPDQEAVVVDLGTGSGALALSAAFENPGCKVFGVELSETALAWARRNATTAFTEAGTPEAAERVEILHGDAAQALPGWECRVDAVITNPPYIPTSATPKDPEVAEHDPEMALYGGSEDGMAIPETFVRRAAQLLKPGGLLVMEHAEVQKESASEVLAAAGFESIETIPDLTGRPRATKGYAGT